VIACLDVYYRGDAATAACVLLNDWRDATPARELTRTIDRVAPYEPGEFYKRELPCLLAVLSDVTPTIVVIDGYVWLDAHHRKGLGAHLHDAIGIPVVGVAKTEFAGAPALRVVRGTSNTPLLVSAIGMDEAEAAQHVRTMHGPFRIPTMLKRVDQLSRR